MKLTKKEQKLFVETHDKWLKENNFLAKLFAKRVTKAVETDKDIQKAVSDADVAIEKTRQSIEKKLNGDKEAVKKSIPADVRKYLGFDY
jgi:viroplasmin and RNaseH domain-containing protein